MQNAPHISSQNELFASDFSQKRTGIYSFGFNSQEKDDEVYGSTGTSYTAQFWQYDSRLGRRWNLDPKPNPSISQYATFNLNPIMFSDILGDTVRYQKGFKGLNERFNVAIGKLFSKNFRKEFNILKESKNVYTYNNTKQTGEDGRATGGISLNKTNLDESGNIVNREFTINYTTKDKGQAAPIGKSPLHGLFEETFHSADYETGRSGMEIVNNALGWKDIGRRQYGEAIAWKFAADNAPFPLIAGFYYQNGVKVRTSQTLIGKIRSEDNIKNIAKLLFKPVIIKNQSLGFLIIESETTVRIYDE